MSELSLHAAPGIRINARLKPALELADGRVLRFDSPDLTADSAYFASPPRLTAPGLPPRLHGLVRAGICRAGETVCRTVELPL